MRSTKRQATEELPSMSNLDIEVFFGWDRIGIGTAVTRGKFPAFHLTPTGEYLWMRSDVERWALERNLPDLEQVRRRQLPEFWHEFLQAVIANAATPPDALNELTAQRSLAYPFRVSVVSPSRGTRMMFVLTERAIRVITLLDGHTSNEMFELRAAADSVEVVMPSGVGLRAAAWCADLFDVWGRAVQHVRATP